MIKKKAEKLKVIYKEMIFLDIDCNSREEVFDFVTRHAKKNKLINNDKLFREDLEDRESKMATNIGYLVGLPHSKSESVDKPFVSFLRFKNCIEWSESNEGEKVKLVFMIGVPKENTNILHLKIISELSKRLLDVDFRELLLNSDQVNGLYNQLSKITLKEENK